jgi:hypothetical protein
MERTVVIKLTKSSINSGPFNIYDMYGNLLLENISRDELISGVAVLVTTAITAITIESIGKCKSIRNFGIGQIKQSDLAKVTYVPSRNACLWTHLKNPVIYNYFYGNIEPYIIEYPFSYQFNDEIIQNVKDYTKAYKYLPDTDRVSDECDKIETDDVWFNKAIVYNGQQSSGILKLVPKPINNLKAYNQYPIYNTDSKTIMFTKSDNFYQYNTFWNVVKDRSTPLFLRSCESLSIDKIVNQANMDYGLRSFKKETFRAKDVKVRHILDDRYDAHLVSQFIVTPSQISYK